MLPKNMRNSQQLEDLRNVLCLLYFVLIMARKLRKSSPCATYSIFMGNCILNFTEGLLFMYYMSKTHLSTPDHHMDFYPKYYHKVCSTQLYAVAFTGTKLLSPKMFQHDNIPLPCEHSELHEHRFPRFVWKNCTTCTKP